MGWDVMGLSRLPVRAWLGVLVILCSLIALAIPVRAEAVGSGGTTYALQYGRTGGPGIAKFGPDGSSRGAVPALSGVDVEQLHAPVGITVDAEGYLIVADADGYEHRPMCTYMDGPNLIDPGCGAILRIDPDTGATEVLSKGNKIVNPYGVLLPADGSVKNGGDDSLIVSDSSEGLIRVDMTQPAGSRESYFPGPGQDLSNSRVNWDIARDPLSGDILAVNTGVPGGGPSVGCPDQRTGYVARYTAGGAFIRSYCDPRITAPRSIAVDSKGIAYVSDPITRNGDQSYGAVFRISPDGAVDYFTAGDQLRTPSGVAFDYGGTRLLIADEVTTGSDFAPTGGRGGIVAVDAFGGDQSSFVSVGNYPIDVAVDKRGATKPPTLDETIETKLKIKKKRKKGKPKRKTINLVYSRVSSFDDDPVDSKQSGPGGGFSKLKFENVEPGSKLEFECTDSACEQSAGSLENQVYAAPADGSFQIEVGGNGLIGQFRLFSYRNSSTKGRVVGFVKDFTAGFDNAGGLYSKDTSKCLVYPVMKIKGKPAGPKRVCGKTPAQVIAKDKKVLRRILLAHVVGGKGGKG